MVWSYWFSKIKRSISNPEQRSVLLKQESGDAFFLPNFSDNRALLELLITTNILALIMALLAAGSLPQLRLVGVAQYVFFMNWVTVSFAWLADVYRPQLRQLPRIQAVIYSFLLLECIVLLATVVCNIGLSWVLHADTAWWAHIGYNLVLGAGLGALIMRYLYVREHMIRRHRAELLSRVQALQARIRPHFLFNTLNSVLSLIAVDPVKAERVLENLAQLFRASLNARGEVCLLDELALCKQYLTVESIRLGSRLQVEWQLPSDDLLYEVNIPSLTLQPLLENAIYHGVEPLSEPSTISIFIEITQVDITIVITNPCQIDKTNTRIGNRMALDNIQQRLQVYYGNRASLKTYQGKGLFTAYLFYPYAPE